MRIPLIIPVLAVGTLLVASACRYINSQEDVEAKFARNLIDCMKIYQITSTNAPVTNMSQLFLYYYPYEYHEKLSRFGKHAGFQTSIVEKYIFFWPLLTHSNLYGEVICMSALPFPGTDERMSRIYISKIGPHTYSYVPIGEERVQAIL